jgi:hypothetical protein
MVNKEKTKTQDGGEAHNGDIVWFMVDGMPHNAALIIGYHDKLHKLYNTKASLTKAYSIPIKSMEVTVVLSESCRLQGSNTYIFTFDGRPTEVRNKVVRFNCYTDETLAEIGERINTKQIDELTIKYV